MAKALKYPTVFRVLLDGGHICEKQPTVGRVKWTVHINLQTIGHITETQFQDLYNAGLLHHTNTRNDKSGASLSYFVLMEG